MKTIHNMSGIVTVGLLVVLIANGVPPIQAQPDKPVLHGQHWVAITGKPLGATAGARMFHMGGNAVDAACAMLGVVSTMFDDLSWGGETQALIFDPNQKKVIGVNALGVAPTGATAQFFLKQDYKYPPGEGPLAAVTPGTPGGLLTLLAEFGSLSLSQVLAPSMEMAEGFPIDAELVRKIRNAQKQIQEWPYSSKVLLPHDGEAPIVGEIFRQPDLLRTLKKLVEAESSALAEGKSRKEAILAAYDRFYRGDIAQEFVRGSQEQGGLHTLEDLSRWQVHLEEPIMSTYRGVEVYKLTTWVQGPVMLQALNMLEHFDVANLSYNTARYIHLLYQVMNLAYADRDFYYGDPYFPPKEPIQGLLSKEYAQQRIQDIQWEFNDSKAMPGDPYPFQGERNPYADLIKSMSESPDKSTRADLSPKDLQDFLAGTTSIQAADRNGWVVSVTPSGGWIPACIAGRTGIGMSQRMQSFILKADENPFNVVAPGKRPRATLTPGLAMKDGKPFLSFAVQGGDSQDQDLLQFFLNVVEFGMNVQEACEAANITSYQMKSSFGDHKSSPGKLTLNSEIPSWTRKDLREMGYQLDFDDKTSGPITAIYFDQEHGTFWGGASDHGEDYGIAW